MHFIIGLFLLCVIFAVPALRAVALVLLLIGGVGAGWLIWYVQDENARVHARACAAHLQYYHC